MDSTLLCLPKDTLVEIFSLLTAKDLVQFSKTCKYLFRISLDQTLWKKLCSKDFSLNISGSSKLELESWRDTYGKRYSMEQRYYVENIQKRASNEAILDDARCSKEQKEKIETISVNL